jgi:hypothetical protein
MNFDAQRIFGNLAEKERLKGHHSPEGRAIRTMSRALHGWSANSLSVADVVALCHQAVEDWLKSRMKVSRWSAVGLAELAAAAERTGMLTVAEAEKLRQVHEKRCRLPNATFTVADAEDVLQDCVEIVEERWG